MPTLYQVVSCYVSHCVKPKSSKRQMTQDGKHLDQANAPMGRQRDCYRLSAELIACTRILLSAMTPEIFEERSDR